MTRCGRCFVGLRCEDEPRGDWAAGGCLYGDGACGLLSKEGQEAASGTCGAVIRCEHAARLAASSKLRNDDVHAAEWRAGGEVCGVGAMPEPVPERHGTRGGRIVLRSLVQEKRRLRVGKVRGRCLQHLARTASLRERGVLRVARRGDRNALQGHRRLSKYLQEGARALRRNPLCKAVQVQCGLPRRRVRRRRAHLRTALPVRRMPVPVGVAR